MSIWSMYIRMVHGFGKPASFRKLCLCSRKEKPCLSLSFCLSVSVALAFSLFVCFFLTGAIIICSVSGLSLFSVSFFSLLSWCLPSSQWQLKIINFFVPVTSVSFSSDGQPRLFPLCICLSLTDSFSRSFSCCFYFPSSYFQSLKCSLDYLCVIFLVRRVLKFFLFPTEICLSVCLSLPNSLSVGLSFCLCCLFLLSSCSSH